MHVGMLLFPNLTQLDLTGPAEVFYRMPGARVDLLWTSLEPVTSDTGMSLLPTMTFDDCRTLDLICVPGGPGQIELMDHAATLQFLRRIAPTCQLVTSVCTGSLILAAAGLLKGYRATSHWASVDQLKILGAIPVSERVVRDRDRVTGAGVTSGIDFALGVVHDMLGEEVAKMIQLQMEYDPQPPFASGSERSASADLVAKVREGMKPVLERRRAATEAAARRLTERQAAQ